MNIKQVIPTAPEVAREAIIVLGGVLIAAFVISRFPALQKFVMANSVTLKTEDGAVVW